MEAKDLIKEELEISKKRLKAAELLLQNNMLEDSVNRIYYSLFYATKAMLNILGFDPKTHSGLISEFGLRIIKTKLLPQQYGKILRKAFEMRESGDYQITTVFEKSEINELLIDAKKFLKTAKEFVKKRF